MLHWVTFYYAADGIESRNVHDYFKFIGETAICVSDWCSMLDNFSLDIFTGAVFCLLNLFPHCLSRQASQSKLSAVPSNETSVEEGTISKAVNAAKIKIRS